MAAVIGDVFWTEVLHALMAAAHNQGETTVKEPDVATALALGGLMALAFIGFTGVLN